MPKVNRKRVGDFEVGDVVELKYSDGIYRIVGFPSRRIVAVRNIAFDGELFHVSVLNLRKNN